MTTKLFVSTLMPPVKDGAPTTVLLSIAPKTVLLKVIELDVVPNGVEVALAFSVPPAKLL